MKKQSGFTLIELLLVLAIIGIISAIAIPALLGQRARARDKSCIANVNGALSDMIAGYDKYKDSGATATTAATFWANVCGTSTTPLITQVFTSVNPWLAGALAYNATVVTETLGTGTTTATTAAAGTLGQVYTGFLPPTMGVGGIIVMAVLLNSPTKDGTGTTTRTYLNIASVELPHFVLGKGGLWAPF